HPCRIKGRRECGVLDLSIRIERGRSAIIAFAPGNRAGKAFAAGDVAAITIEGRPALGGVGGSLAPGRRWTRRTTTPAGLTAVCQAWARRGEFDGQGGIATDATTTTATAAASATAAAALTGGLGGGGSGPALGG